MEQAKETVLKVQAPRKTFTVPIWVLACIQTFTIWQMGIVFYSGRTLTVNGSTPFPVSIDDAVLPIALGYIAGAVVALVLSEKVGLVARIDILISLGCILLMFGNLPIEMYAILFYIIAFTCTTFIGIIGTLAINVYSLKIALKDGIIASIVSSPFIALLHLSGFVIDFKALNVISAIIQILMFIGVSKIPTKIEMKFLPVRTKGMEARTTRPPFLLLVGSFFIYTIICFCTLFSSTTVESITNGIPIFYIAAIFWALVFLVLYYKMKLDPFEIVAVYMAVAAIGFILWLLPMPQVIYISIFMQGTSLCLCNLAWFIMAILSEKWNWRGIAPLAIFITLITVLIHSAILEVLRDNTALLYAVYAVIALVLLVINLYIAPYFRRVWIDSSADAATAINIDFGVLTKREIEIVELVVQGYINEDIAKTLFISEHTVKTHMKNIFQKLDVHTLFELATKINKIKR